jgi:hypothetical protein
VKKDFIDLSSREVNELLPDKWNISLFKFAQIFAHGASDWALEIEKPITKRTALSVSKSLCALRKHILKTMINIQKSLRTGLDKNTSEERLIESCQLRPFFDHLSLMDRIYGGREHGFQEKKGARLKKRNNIVASWGILIEKSGGAIDWDFVAKLYEWFWMKLENYDYYKPLKPPKDDPVRQFSTTFHRHKKNWFCQASALSGMDEDITIFYPTGTSCTLSHNYIYHLLKTEYNKLIVPRAYQEPSRYLGRTGGAIPGTRNEEMKSYYRYAIELFLRSGVDLRKLPPLIIFPDKSYFSTAF